jgi:hypothetical protein
MGIFLTVRVRKNNNVIEHEIVGLFGQWFLVDDNDQINDAIKSNDFGTWSMPDGTKQKGWLTFPDGLKYARVNLRD